VPFLKDPDILAAYRELESMTTALGEQSKLMRICQGVKTYHPDAPKRALLYTFEALRVNLAFADLDPEDLTSIFLSGDAKDVSSVGFSATCCAKLKFIDWIVSAAAALGQEPGYTELISELRTHVWPHFASPGAFWKKNIPCR
jgi:hypothetical protein